MNVRQRVLNLGFALVIALSALAVNAPSAEAAYTTHTSNAYIVTDLGGEVRFLARNKLWYYPYSSYFDVDWTDLLIDV